MYNGRVNIISDNLDNESIPLFTENNSNQKKFNAAKTILTQNDPIYLAFFSNKNIELIQDSMKNLVFKQSDGRYQIENQSYEQLEIIMNSIYLQYGKFQKNNIPGQVKELNRLVLNYAIPNILSNIEQYNSYKKDVSFMPEPMSRPVNLNKTGLKMYVN